MAPGRFWPTLGGMRAARESWTKVQAATGAWWALQAKDRFDIDLAAGQPSAAPDM